MRQAQFDWRPYIIEFHAQAPKLMKSRAFVLGGGLELRLSANGVTLEWRLRPIVIGDGTTLEEIRALVSDVLRSMLAPSREKEQKYATLMRDCWMNKTARKLSIANGV